MLNTRCMLCLELADGTMLPVNESRLLCEKLMRRGIVRTNPAALTCSGSGSDCACWLGCVWVVGRSHIGCTRMRTRTVTCC